MHHLVAKVHFLSLKIALNKHNLCHNSDNLVLNIVVTSWRSIYVLLGCSTFLDVQASLATTPVRPSTGKSGILSDLQSLWALTKLWDNIVVADMKVNMVADKVADMVSDMVGNKNKKSGQHWQRRRLTKKQIQRQRHPDTDKDKLIQSASKTQYRLYFS